MVNMGKAHPSDYPRKLMTRTETRGLMMKRVFLSAAAMLAACGVSAVAHAEAPYLNLDLGGGTATFGNTGIDTGPFSNTFTFFYPTGSPVDAVASFISSAIATASKNIEFTTVTLNGTSFTPLSTGLVDVWRYDGPVNFGTTQNTLILGGTVAGGPASYSGTIEFASAAVPEPAAWAIMIGGVGLIGLSARKAKRKQRELATA